MTHAEPMRYLAAAALLATLTACGSHAAAAPHPRTLGDLEAAVSCQAGTVQDASGELFTSGGAECTTPAGDTHVYTFASTANRDNWLKVAQSFGGGFVLGDGWAVSTDSRDGAVQLQKAAGGTAH